MNTKNRRRWSVLGGAVALSLLGAMTHLAAPTASADEPNYEHTGLAVSPYANHTMRWTRADAMKIMDLNNPNVVDQNNSMDESVTMPDIARNFPTMKDKNGKQVWVWDTWPLTDAHGNQYSYNGWNVIFSLVADPYAGYTFDDRHVHARIGYWYANASDPKAAWIYGGQVFANQTPSTQAEWSGSARIFDDGQIKLFYTHLNFANRDKPIAEITLATGQIHADSVSSDNPRGVWFTGFRAPGTKLLAPEGKWYQTNDQNPYFSFRDPFTFEDPKYPGKTFMVFEGNTAGARGSVSCTAADLGGSGEDPATVTKSGANFQMANIGLAVATKSDLSAWKFLPPILSGNCVNDQTERPQFVIKKVDGQWKYYLFTISHAFTYAAGLRGPDGVYGFVGDGIRSDFLPLNGSGLALGNPTNLNVSPLDPMQDTRQYQAYSHYVMPGGLVESFIDNVDGRRGGTLAPTVKINLDGDTSTVDRSVGNGGLLGYGYIPANLDMTVISDDNVTARQLQARMPYSSRAAVRSTVRHDGSTTTLTKISKRSVSVR